MGTTGTLDTAKVDALIARARREVDEGFLPSAQVALARDGELIAFEAFGDATTDTRYVVFSCTKAFVAGAMWALIGDGLVDVSKRVVEYVPEFGTNGKDVITVEQVMLHTAGFPHAPLGPPLWTTPRGPPRGVRQVAAQLGARHVRTSTTPRRPTGCWPSIIERVTGADFRDVVEERVTGPAGLPRVLGLDPSDAGRHRRARHGRRAGHARGDQGRLRRRRAAGHRGDRRGAVWRSTGPTSARSACPAAVASMRACDLALYYQALLHDQGEHLEARRPRRRHHQRPQPHSPSGGAASPPTAASGLILAGDDGYSHIRGLGRTVSPGAFGHNGAGGQLAWADPATGLSLGYTTNGYDLHVVREPRRGTAISSLAGECVQVGRRGPAEPSV